VQHTPAPRGHKTNIANHLNHRAAGHPSADDPCAPTAYSTQHKVKEEEPLYNKLCIQTPGRRNNSALFMQWVACPATRSASMRRVFDVLVFETFVCDFFPEAILENPIISLPIVTTRPKVIRTNHHRHLPHDDRIRTLVAL
jgi:hypothetical protein